MHSISLLVQLWFKKCCMKWKVFSNFHYLAPLISKWPPSQQVLPRVPLHKISMICVKVIICPILIILRLTWWWHIFLCCHIHDKCIQICKLRFENINLSLDCLWSQICGQNTFGFGVFGLVVPLMYQWIWIDLIATPRAIENNVPNCDCLYHIDHNVVHNYFCLGLF